MMNPASPSATATSSSKIQLPSSSMIRFNPSFVFILPAALLIAGCGSLNSSAPPAAAASPPQACAPVTATCAPCNCERPADKPEPPVKPGWQRATWAQLPGWSSDTHDEAWSAFLRSCGALKRQALWQAVCAAAERQAPEGARGFFETRFVPWRRVDGAGGANPGPVAGLITGYYEPLLTGSRTRRAPFNYPVYGVPDDLLTIDLGELRPDLKGQRLRGRVDNRRVLPYYSRAEIEAGRAQTGGRELLYVDDAIDLFFLMVQGSGRVRLDDGQTVRLNYADQNGHPYRSIGRLLVDRGDLRLDQASMQGIKAWARANPAKLADLLNANPSYVFFRETGVYGAGGAEPPGPVGALGVPLTSARSLAVDPAFVPLGAPVWLATTWPNSTRALERLMLAQDTGGAIRGANRGDFFWGFGDEAAREAGRMRQSGEIWLLWPATAGEPPG